MLKLTVVCLAYNQERFIKQALDSLLRQETNFAYEILVHDDASTDKTQEIVRTYEKMYPNKIRGIYQKSNQWSTGKGITKNFVSPLIRGEYVAFCEGDDYWTDVTKLQEQVDFLDSHPDYSICFHPVTVLWENETKPATVAPNKRMLKKFQRLNLEQLLKVNFIQTNSVVYRWRFHNDDIKIFPDGIMPGDWFLHLLHAECGKIGYIDKEMAVYRRHSRGVWTGSKNSQDWFVRNSDACIRFFETVEEHFHVSKKTEIEFYREMKWYATNRIIRKSIKMNPLYLFYLLIRKSLSREKNKADMYKGRLRAAVLYFKYWYGR